MRPLHAQATTHVSGHAPTLLPLALISEAIPIVLYLGSVLIAPANLLVIDIWVLDIVQHAVMLLGGKVIVSVTGLVELLF